MLGVRANEFNFTSLLCKIIGITNPANCGRTPVNGVKTPGNGIKSPGNGIKSPGNGVKSREMQMTPGNSRAYFASDQYFHPNPKHAICTMCISYLRSNLFAET